MQPWSFNQPVLLNKSRHNRSVLVWTIVGATAFARGLGLAGTAAGNRGRCRASCSQPGRCRTSNPHWMVWWPPCPSKRATAWRSAICWCASIPAMPKHACRQPAANACQLRARSPSTALFSASKTKRAHPQPTTAAGDPTPQIHQRQRRRRAKPNWPAAALRLDRPASIA